MIITAEDARLDTQENLSNFIAEKIDQAIQDGNFKCSFVRFRLPKEIVDELIAKGFKVSFISNEVHLDWSGDTEFTGLGS